MVQKRINQFSISIDSKSAVPVYKQIKQEIKHLIISGILKGGEQLIPIRELASTLQVNHNTIVKVYYQLDVEGYINSQPGSGYFVNKDYPKGSKEVTDLFKKITDEYISKSLNIGYTVKDIISELKKRVK